MNCNSSTAPLQSTAGAGCNTGCTPKPINIVCRNIIIPIGQEILAVEGDLNSSFREFLIPLETEQGFSLENSTFSILVMNSNGEQYQVILNSKDITIQGNYIKIRWDLSARDTSVAGDLKISIQATRDGFRWETYSTTFRVEPSLGGVVKMQPPVLLQQKVVIPSNKEQIILPDAGYDGLSAVIIQAVDGGGSSLTLDDVFNSITTSNSLVKKVVPSQSLDISGENVENRALSSSEINNILDK